MVVGSPVTAGGTVSVSFEIINQGIVATDVPNWSDKVYLSLDNKLSADDILIGSYANQTALGAGDRYRTETNSAVIPIRFAGPAYIIVSTDGNSQLDEYPNERDNIKATAINVTPVPKSDLITSNVVVPTQAIHGSEIEVRYKVTNNGAAATSEEVWQDTIWITRDARRPNPLPKQENDGGVDFVKGNSAILLATVTHVGVLQIGGSYEEIVRVVIPDDLPSGRYYITPWSDSYDIELEDTLAINLNPDDPNEIDNNNYKARAIDVLGVPAVIREPDLIVTSVTATPIAQAGEDQITVNWTVVNTGLGNADTAAWIDTVYVSDQPVWGAGGAKVWTLGSMTRVGGLAIGASYDATATFALSPAISGRYVFVVTDQSGTLKEDSDTNNVGRGDTSITNTPADLRVETISAPPVNYSGEPTTVTWKIKNYGGDAWDDAKLWRDAVWISPYPTFDRLTSSLLNIVTHDNSSPLRSGESYTVTADVVLPAGYDGPYYLYVITDSDGYGSAPISEDVSGNNESSREFYGFTLFEGGQGFANNFGIGSINVTYQEPNLEVTTLVVPVNPPSSGDEITVNWTVTNTGTRATREDSWTDRVFLSRDPSLDTGDFSLGDYLRRGKLAANASYNASLTFRLPEGISGDFYLLVQTDTTAQASGYSRSSIATELPGLSSADGRVPEFLDEGDNVTSAPLTINLRVPPNLKVTSITIPENAFMGQAVDLTYVVSNVGGGAVPASQGKWQDLFYLSRDQNLDTTNDIYLGSSEHIGPLAAGGSYIGLQNLRLPQGLSGTYYILVATDLPTQKQPRGLVFEGSKDNDNVSASPQPLIIDVPPPSDLIVSNVIAASNGNAGAPVHITWSVTNEANEAAIGSWKDAIYLSDDNVWDITDQLIGRVDHNGTLIKNQSYTGTLDAVLPPVRDGQYRIVVRSDVLNQVYEGQNDANNTGASQGTLFVSSEELHLNVPIEATLSTGQTRVYHITVDEGETLRVTLTSPDGGADNELFLRYDDVPTGFKYDAAYQNPLQANQAAVIGSTKPGDYYVLVRGHHEPSANTPFTLTATTLPFSITSVKPDQGGDSKYVTVTIEGAKFDDNAIVKLSRPGIAEYEPLNYLVVNSTKIVAIFDLTNAPAWPL